MLAKLTDFKRLGKSTDKLAVLFLGSIEQHGPFMPLGTDTLFAEKLSEALEKRLGDKLVLFPVLPFGAAKEHQGFAGTISIEYATYMLLLKDILKSLSESGFKKVVLISTHGGNDLVARLIQADWNYGSKMKVDYLWALDEAVDQKCKELFGGSEMHAGSSENSMIAYLCPETVGFIGKKVDKRFAPSQKGVFTLFATREVTPLGILNFSPELEVDIKKGKILFDFTADNLCRKVKKMIE